MRRVTLEHAAPAEGAEAECRVKKLTGHLWARLMELEEDGLRVLSPTDAQAGAGMVLAAVPGRDGQEFVRRLRRDWGVLCAGTPQGAVCFYLGPEHSFEELDYVQDVVYKLLLQN